MAGAPTNIEYVWFDVVKYEVSHRLPVEVLRALQASPGYFASMIQGVAFITTSVTYIEADLNRDHVLRLLQPYMPVEERRGKADRQVSTYVST